MAKKKPIPQTEEAAEAEKEARNLKEETKALNQALDEAASGKALVVQKTYEPADDSPFEVADDLGERVLSGDPSAFHQLNDLTEKAEQEALANFTKSWQQADEEAQKIRHSTGEEKQALILQQQAVSDQHKRMAMLMTMRSFRDLQKLRIGIGNQIYAWGRSNILGLSSSEKALTGSQAAKIMAEIKDEYRHVSEGMATKILRQRKNQSALYRSKFDASVMVLVDLFMLVEQEEKRMVSNIEILCADFEIYNRFLKPIPGIGPLTSGSLIALLDFLKAQWPSSYVKYAGLDVVFNEKTQRAEGRNRRQEHLIERKYIDRDGNEQTKLSITFNPELKRVLYNMADSFIKSGTRVDPDKPLETWPGHKVPIYRTIYDGYKHRVTVRNELNDQGLKKSHIEAMSKRKMEQIFLHEMFVMTAYLLGIYDKIRLPYAVVYHGKEFHTTFTPVREITLAHGRTDWPRLDEIKQRDERLREAGFAKGY